MAAKLKVLVIDDEEAIRETLCDNLELCGFQVFKATDGEHGLRLINANDPPAIVITDIIMPRKEGLETIMEIKKIHFSCFSAHSEKRDVEQVAYFPNFLTIQK